MDRVHSVHVLIAPDCFTGTLTATQAAEAIAAGWRRKAPDDLLTLNAAEQNGYALRAGTSEAAPLVSGVVSLMWGANPNLSAAEVRARLLASTRPVDGLKVLDAQAAVAAALK